MRERRIVPAVRSVLLTLAGMLALPPAAHASDFGGLILFMALAALVPALALGAVSAAVWAALTRGRWSRHVFLVCCALWAVLVIVFHEPILDFFFAIRS